MNFIKSPIEFSVLRPCLSGGGIFRYSQHFLFAACWLKGVQSSMQPVVRCPETLKSTKALAWPLTSHCPVVIVGNRTATVDLPPQVHCDGLSASHQMLWQPISTNAAAFTNYRGSSRIIYWEHRFQLIHCMALWGLHWQVSWWVPLSKWKPTAWVFWFSTWQINPIIETERDCIHNIHFSKKWQGAQSSAFLSMQ